MSYADRKSTGQSIEDKQIAADRIRTGLIGQNTLMTAMLTGVTVIVDESPESDEKKFYNGPGSDIWVKFKTKRGDASFNLATFTVDELAAFREMVDTAIRMAQPICQARDDESEEMTDDEGLGTDWRFYRAVPQVLVAGGQDRADCASLHLGPDWDDEVGRFSQRRLRVPRRGGQGVAGRRPLRGTSAEDTLA